MMTVTLTLDVGAVNSVSTSTSRFERQIYAMLFVKGNPRLVSFQLHTVRKVDLPETHEIRRTNQMLSMYSQHKIRSLGVSTLALENPKTKETYVSNF